MLLHRVVVAMLEEDPERKSVYVGIVPLARLTVTPKIKKVWGLQSLNLAGLVWPSGVRCCFPSEGSYWPLRHNLPLGGKAFVRLKPRRTGSCNPVILFYCWFGSLVLGRLTMAYLLGLALSL